ncbi:MAG: hypothetical protein IPJ24_01620 [bacterium]|nr:hypothetical protein [bacterium]
MRHVTLRPAPGLAILAILFLAGAAAATERQATSQPALYFSASTAKAAGDTVDLMGPGGLCPYRGDFETADARPGGAGLLPDGWYSVDETAPANHWHVDTYGVAAPLSGRVAWCGTMALASCGAGDLAGGYNNSWNDILEFRKTVGGMATVRVQADLVYDTEPGYDFMTLQRRTAASPQFEPLTGGQGLSWDGIGTAAVDYTFTYAASELYEDTDIAVAFIFSADGAWSDGDCLWPTSGAARVDNITVTVNGVPYVENFEDGLLGPDWSPTPNTGVGDFARVWGVLGDLDDCASNYSKLVAFIDDGLVVPGTGGTVGGPGNDYGPPGGYIVNNTGGLLGPSYHIQNSVYSPVMTLPDPGLLGMTLAFDVYRHELLIAMDSPGIFYTWSIRTETLDFDIETAGWRDRNFVYYGGPRYVRSINVVDDLVVPGAGQVQLTLGVYELGYMFCWDCTGTNGTPAPYFDNVSLKVYPTTGPRLVATEIRLANDGFPAIGDIDLASLGANSVRFDMAANISARTHLRNDPGDSIWIDATPRSGGTLDTPVLHWTFARRNDLFDPYRTLPGNPVTGRVTRTASGAVVANRYNFDLPDTGMIFPGDVLHYYFAASDHVGGDTRTATMPGDISQFGNPEALLYPGAFSVSGLPSIVNAAGDQPEVLFWNDFGFRGGQDEWHHALQYAGWYRGIDYDVFDTHGPSSGVGNGLGGRATISQVDGYTDMFYTAGDLSTYTLSNGDFAGDPGNDIGLLNAWLGLGNRDLFMTGDDVAQSLYTSGTAARTFLETRMGLSYLDGDIRDNIGGQVAPLAVRVEGNPVFTTAGAWIAYGGCAGINDFDAVVPSGAAVRLAEFTAYGGVQAPYSYAAATLKAEGGSRVVSMNHDLMYVMNPPAKYPAPPSSRTILLGNVMDYFGLNQTIWVAPAEIPDAAPRLAVAANPNPFNPVVTLAYTLPAPGHVVMKVFDVRGALVRTLLDGPVVTASGTVAWDGADDGGDRAASGLYFVETRSEGQVDVRKVTMLK